MLSFEIAWLAPFNGSSERSENSLAKGSLEEMQKERPEGKQEDWNREKGEWEVIIQE